MTVTHTTERVWIDGVTGFNPAEYASSVHGTQARILQTIGEPLSYEDLICYSAFAFRVGVHEQMCPSAGHPCCGFMCLNGFRALPWETKFFEASSANAVKDKLPDFKAEACAAIKESIDHGVPVHYGSEEDGIIIGYADNGKRWWCIHPYHKWGSEAFWHDEGSGFAGGEWPWGIVVWTKPKPVEQRVPERDLTIAALQQAVEMWNAEKRNDYYGGEAAYTHWLTWLYDVDSGLVDDPRGGMQGNGWYYDVLIHSRRIASHWLQELAKKPELSTATEHLRIAADQYTQLAAECLRDIDCPWSLALSPDRFDDWTSAMRQEQSMRLETARIYDRAAITSLEKALESMQ